MVRRRPVGYGATKEGKMNTLVVKAKKFTAEYLQREIMKARPWALTAIILRISASFPKIKPAFMDTIALVGEVPNPCFFLYQSLEKLGSSVPWFIRVVFYLAKKIVPDCIVNAILHFVVNVILIPYFEITDERAFEKAKEKFAKDGSQIILDIVGEAARNEDEADIYMKSYKYVMRQFGGKMAVKPSSLVWKPDKELLKQKLAELFSEARHYPDVSITVDAEEYFDWCHITEEAFLETIMEPRFRNMKNEVGIALQTYRKDAFESAIKIIETAQKRKNPIRVRVVKGAYWGDEHTIAKKLGKEFPLFEKQEDTDESFDDIVMYLLLWRNDIHVSIATHNAKHIAWGIKLTKGDYSNFEWEGLTGMGESIRRVLRKIGVPASMYCPLIRKGGTPKEGMKYLTRRVKEVTENCHVLKNV
jgi:RHH-type proline utilization regulon transcriptional repressor/proline dehydrogenase/delta 1-pyrroline-5-carboxylate dehydrogenase